MRKLKNEELGRISIEEFKQTAKTPIIVVLDNVRSLNNIGSVFRTSDAFCIEGIYLCGITATPPNKDIHKTALGATESVHWEYFEDTLQALEKLRTLGYKIISIEQAEHSISLEDFEIGSKEKYALIFGHEVKGVDQVVINQSNYCIEIPQFGTKHSFNISVSAGIVLWEFFRKLRGT
ncbi:MAG TPA: RNA methyltransferase [Marinilabiliales bacterium]|jgi:tRNA G18 (ribose-2'-O)-methylase SpoU|nr:MAG: RNA methyltransferase [Bacteroidetes bacterium GWA2_40_14]OFX61832.1 MAG: RNA methyltransferase [Bacteroidetes bacterium GWC2_40_13]OFX75812.1 MAG: RNA methyltransferase [Bacteroidetes bacterium GWD2_40_43]OFX94915.1 MAG: RNA methyltransferase [Bacteroidetes bacterium GWE2_40_63]OFY23429.1 MAG: RNA methyltransferase [Bacteroidetes bacterium GWF2_40_13]OFZ29444.1 MAG: RNA methyltransferase [Bacteroidetes bacterium RIFOXYC2_FULL_40_12]HAM98691.1 RNA methyltransferase [Marinilabiliales b